MVEQTILETARLQLRLIELTDMLDIQRTACIREVADTMISLPHPYPVGEAERYISRKQDEREAGTSVTFIIEKKAGKEFCGLIEVLSLNRLYAYHMLRNPATGRVLDKNGFRQEGLLRQRVQKWGKFEDVVLMAILKQDWLAGVDN